VPSTASRTRGLAGGGVRLPPIPSGSPSLGPLSRARTRPRWASLASGGDWTGSCLTLRLAQHKREGPWRGRSGHAVEAPEFAGTSCVTEAKRTAMVAVGQGASGNTREGNAGGHGEHRTAGRDVSK
jgi:hypothetical protein